MNQVELRPGNGILTAKPGRRNCLQRIVCTETADNVLLPSVQVARVNHRGEAERHGGRPHGVFEVVPLQSPVKFNQTLVMSTMCCWNCGRTTIIATGQAIGKPRTRTQPYQKPKHRTIQTATENRDAAAEPFLHCKNDPTLILTSLTPNT